MEKKCPLWVGCVDGGGDLGDKCVLVGESWFFLVCVLGSEIMLLVSLGVR